MSQFTHILREMGSGNAKAADQLLPLVYEDNVPAKLSSWNNEPAVP